MNKYGSNPSGFRERLEELGFFDDFKSGIGGEQIPFVKKQGVSRKDLTRMAYGYTTRIPPLHTLAIYNAIANDGKYVRPHLVKKLSLPGSNVDSIIPVSYVRQQVCSPENAEKLRIMLHDVVWGSHGTARSVRHDNVEIAGKTGTAKITFENKPGYSDETRVAFCGFFPYKAPKYSCIVLMRGANRGAGGSSGTVLKNVAAKMYSRGLLGANDNLDDSSTPKREASRTPYEKTPTLYSSTQKSRITNVKNYVNTANAKILVNKPTPQGSGVPNVCGLNIRDAVNCLEKVGLNVRFKGVGRVVSQSLSAGSSFNRREMITLTLSS